ncbi:cyclic GMP-AMP synthase [Archocentrus centrarchus]|uniref:cyclic GMP-AMP synthase n=1 Tax=Archocentrus centrarchus TaxID=63155 RepID=UPI0011EA3978|nr:cyclic GMP-AMP synthase-like [Archocentrus centrarchus]
MSGRGRSRKAKSPDAEHAKRKPRLDDIKEVPLPTRPDSTEEEQKKKKEEKKKTINAEEKKPLERPIREKTTNHCTKKVNEHPHKSTDSTTAKTCATKTNLTEKSPVVKRKATKDSPKVTRANKCSGGAKSQEQLAKDETPTGTSKSKTCVKKAKSPGMFSEEMTKMPPDTPKDTTQDYVETDKAKACGAKPKRQVAKMQPEQCLETEKETPKYTRKTSEKTTEAKICARRANSPEKLRKTPNMPPGKGEDFTKDTTEKNPAVDDILKETLEKLKIKKTDKSNAALVINTTKDYIIRHLKKNTESFKEVQEPLPTGSYYENVKICNPDEFDIMVPILVERVEIKPFGDDGAFYSVALKRDKNPLRKFQENGHLSASNMLSEFREEVKKCVKGLTDIKWKVEKKKKGCPAVTLTTNVNSVPVSLDVVLCLMVKSSWPSFTNEGLKIEGWLGTKVKQEYKRKPYYLVPKYEGRGAAENDGVLTKDVWRVSFSHVEKAILKNHGSEKTCCEKHGASCCRKSCLKLLKHLLHLLKESNPSFDKFCSYHVKTTLLHACCSRTRDSDWKPADLSHCFQLLLKDFENHLQNGQLQNFFIPSQNLLSGPGIKVCRILSSTIKNERQTGFPIFSEQLQNAH